MRPPKLSGLERVIFYGLMAFAGAWLLTVGLFLYRVYHLIAGVFR